MNKENIDDSSLERSPSLVLTLMRHAKSDWENPNLSDHDRPLNARGRFGTPLVANWLMEQRLCPDRILCSSAARTRETADLLNENFQKKVPVTILPGLYLAAPETIFQLIQRTATTFSDSPNETASSVCRNVLVLAHNPGISQAATWLHSDFVSMVTGAAISFQCNLPDWSHRFDPAQVQTITQASPKTLA